MKYAIIEIAGKQYRVTEGSFFTLDKIDGETDTEIVNKNVLLIGDDSSEKAITNIGSPYIDKASVTLKIVEQLRDDKIRVATYKAKSRYRRVLGHRQHQTKLLVTKITG